jgi:hypothetical protein
MERFRVGLGCTDRYMDVMERFSVGLGCTGRYMDATEGSGGPWVHGQVHGRHRGVQGGPGVHRFIQLT